MLPKQALDKNLVSLDVLLLLLSTPAYIKGQDAYLIVISLLAYILLGLWLPLENYGEQGNRQGRFSFVLRYALLLIIATAAVIIPTAQNIIIRTMTPVESDGFSPAYSTLSDSALQTELALGYLHEGRNPYAESYENTPLRFYQWVDVVHPDWQDPAFSYFVYLPGTLWLSLPLYKASLAIGIPYDQRVIYLLTYIILLLILPQLAKLPSYKLTIVVAIGLNPLFTDSILLGMNDVAPFLGLTLSVLALVKRRFIWAALFMGIACALKQYVWFVVPFFALNIWEQSTPTQKWQSTLIALTLIGIIVFVVTLPFILWNPQALYIDTLAFPAGRADILYPIRGFSIGRLLMGAGVIPTFVSPFPFQLLQMTVGLPVLLLLLKFQYGQGLGVMLLVAAVFIFVFGFLSRFFHENYVGIVIALGSLGILMNLATQGDNPVREPPHK
jgi:hypothetical protein